MSTITQSYKTTGPHKPNTTLEKVHGQEAGQGMPRLNQKMIEEALSSQDKYLHFKTEKGESAQNFGSS